MKRLYYIVFINGEGVFPQKGSESYDYDEVKREVDKLNKQNDNPYCSYDIFYKGVQDK
jgi:hypothetical protein